MDLNEIKNRISCIEYANKYLGLPVREAGKRCKSFRNGADNPTSLLIDERTWYDFGVGEGGDVIDLCAKSRHGGRIGDAIYELAQITGVQLESYINWEKLNHQAAYYHSKLTDEHLTYLHNRGMKDETINKLLIGYAAHDGQWHNRLMIPYWKSGNVVYFVGRTLGNSTTKYMKMNINDGMNVIWGLDTINREGPVIIAEGIFDALSAYQEGYAVLTAVTGRFSKEQFKDLCNLIRDREIIICMDYDPETKAGQTFTHDLAYSLMMRGYKTKVILLSGGEKKVDLNDLYVQGIHLQDLFKESIDYRYYRVKMIDTQEDLTKFLYKLRRVILFPDLIQLFEHIRKTEKFDSVWLNALEKLMKKPPSDDIILNELIEQYQLLYHEQLGWYEYDKSGVWIRRGDYEVRLYISKLFGTYKSGNRVNSVYILAKSAFVFTGEFNTDPNLLNMKNGMLNIITGKLLPHNASYYSTIQLQYSYQEKMICPEWIQFLNIITDGDEKRKLLIQQMFGYSLQGNCSYQTCFFLLGTGANGKGVLLNMLTEMVSHNNVSNVEISSLNEPFQRISLLHSMVNITTETKADIKGTEAIFKQIVAGEPISGCYKNKDFIIFKPRCKVIAAANEYLESKNISYGFIRRVKFINFPIRFVENPSDDNEREMDRNIFEKLILELPGVLNWALDGLKILHWQNEFTNTDDQRLMMDTFVSLSSPIHDFVNDLQKLLPPAMDGWYSRKAIYDIYRNWCNENGNFSCSAKRFWVNLRTILKISDKIVQGQRYVFFNFKKVQEVQV